MKHLHLINKNMRCTDNVCMAQVAALETVIDEAVAGLDRHLLQTLFKQCALQQHCDALKRYMLHGQGDFIESLMDLIGTQLDEPVRFIPIRKLHPPARLLHCAHACHGTNEGSLGPRVNINEMILQYIEHGQCGARALEQGEITAHTIEVVRRVMTRSLKEVVMYK